MAQCLGDTSTTLPLVLFVGERSTTWRFLALARWTQLTLAILPMMLRQDVWSATRFSSACCVPAVCHAYVLRTQRRYAAARVQWQRQAKPEQELCVEVWSTC